MGLRLPPTGDGYGDNCARCFEPGETPLIRYASFSGIGTGILFNPLYKPPPNYTFRLEQDEVLPCYWHYQGDHWFVGYWAENVEPAIRDSTLILAGPLFPATFEGHGAFCETNFDNYFIGPNNVYEGGAAWIFEKP